MTGYLLRRVLLAAITVLGVTFLVFAAVRLLPGNRVDVLLATGTNSGPGAKAQLEHEMGFDRPFLVQYGHWLGSVATGHLGKSLVNGQSLAFYIKEGLPVSFELGIMSLAIGIVFGVSIGVVSAVRQDTWLDYALRSFAIFLLAMPGFLISVIVIVLASRFWNWNPPLTYIKFTHDPVHNLGQFLLPSTILGFSTAAALMRFTRTAMLEVLRQDYIRTAWSKGLRERGIVTRHALRNSLIPIISVVGIFLAYIVGGTVIFESIFQLPGVGRFLLEEVNTRDYPGIQDITLIFAVVVVFTNLLTDLVYTWVDPRMRA